ncbi:MAG: transporter [Flavobacteriaceae bacterium]|nr:transporter [Flavobacteriaceae bacterium]
MKTNYSGIVYGYSSGDILLNSQEIEGLNAKLNSVAVFYGHSFKILNKPAKYDVVLPYAFGKLNALVSQVDTTAYKNGFIDPSIRVSVILIGDQALNLKEFAQRDVKKFKLGAAFKVKAPLGRYDETKLINLGANRWAFQLKVAASYQPTKKIILELHIDSWFFTENSSFYNGNKLTQKPFFTTQLHMAYLFNPKFWISGSIGQVALGETSINGIEQDNNQENSRYGFTASYKIGKLGSFKFALTNGLYTGSGANFTTTLLGYSFVWFGKSE